MQISEQGKNQKVILKIFKKFGGAEEIIGVEEEYSILKIPCLQLLLKK